MDLQEQGLRYMFLKFFEYSVQKTIAIMEKIGNIND